MYSSRLDDDNEEEQERKSKFRLLLSLLEYDFFLYLWWKTDVSLLIFLSIIFSTSIIVFLFPLKPCIYLIFFTFFTMQWTKIKIRLLWYLEISWIWFYFFIFGENWFIITFISFNQLYYLYHIISFFIKTMHLSYLFTF